MSTRDFTPAYTKDTCACREFFTCEECPLRDSCYAYTIFDLDKGGKGKSR